MKRISNSDLLEGLTCPYEEVKEAYLIFALEKWLTSRNYGPKEWKQVKELQDFLPEDLRDYLQSKTETFLPKVIAKTKGIDFTKVKLVTDFQWWPTLPDDFSYRAAYAALINLDTYPNAGYKQQPKDVLVDQLQEQLLEVKKIYDWEHWFSDLGISRSTLQAFKLWLEKQEKESDQSFDVVQVLCEIAKAKPQFAQEIFDISLYLIGNFREYMNTAVKCLDRFCLNYPKFRQPLAKFLLKNFDRYLWKLEPFDHRTPLPYYKALMEHLTQDNLHFSVSWKMKIMQKVLKLTDDKAVVLCVIDHLKYIYDYQPENVDEAYLKAIETALKKKNVNAADILAIVCAFAKGSLFRRENWWKNFAQYPLSWQKTMVMVYSSSKLSDRYLADAYFSLVRMNKENPWLFDDFEKVASSFLAKKWDVSKQEVRKFFDVFDDMPYAETTASYIQRGFLKLLQLINDEQIRSLQVLKMQLPDYACVFDCAELSEKVKELEAKEEEKRKQEQQDWKEIDRLLSKIQ